MRKRERLLALLLSLCLVLGSAPLQVKAANPAGVQYCNTYENTGDQRKDILNIALSQMGYTELIRNDTKFGDWGGYPRQPWCANFVSWCARQAEVSQDIIKKSHRARPDYFEVESFPGTEYTPQPGDLFFTSGFEHVGMVYKVEGSYFIAIEGNAKEYEQYLSPLWRPENAGNVKGGHGGMDGFCFTAFLDCLDRRDKNVPIDVYDTATWMAITALSEASLAAGSKPMAFPDFTEGAWLTRAPRDCDDFTAPIPEKTND